MPLYSCRCRSLKCPNPFYRWKLRFATEHNIYDYPWWSGYTSQTPISMEFAICSKWRCGLTWLCSVEGRSLTSVLMEFAMCNKRENISFYLWDLKAGPRPSCSWNIRCATKESISTYLCHGFGQVPEVVIDGIAICNKPEWLFWDDYEAWR